MRSRPSTKPTRRRRPRRPRAPGRTRRRRRDKSVHNLRLRTAPTTTITT
jgi:hypothetical protein